MMPIHHDCDQNATAISPVTPTKPVTPATIRLRARPMPNQSNERRICPPSSG